MTIGERLIQLTREFAMPKGKLDKDFNWTDSKFQGLLTAIGKHMNAIQEEARREALKLKVTMPWGPAFTVVWKDGCWQQEMKTDSSLMRRWKK